MITQNLDVFLHALRWCWPAGCMHCFSLDMATALGCAADIIAGNKADHRRLFNLIQQMQREGKIRFTQLIWGGAKGLRLRRRKIYLPKGVSLATPTDDGYTSRMYPQTSSAR